MFKQYSFSEATPFVDFIEANKGRIIGQRIQRISSGAPFGRVGLSDSPAVLELEQFSIVLHYFWVSDITIQIVDSERVHEDPYLKFLNAYNPESCKFGAYVYAVECPLVGEKIADITVDRFSDEFEGTGQELRPANGDYFSVIHVVLEGGAQIRVCAASAELDGYLEIW